MPIERVGIVPNLFLYTYHDRVIDHLKLRWLPRVSTKVSIRTGKGCKRDPNSVVLHSLFLRFASKVTNIITLISQFLLLRHRPLSWQQNV